MGWLIPINELTLDQLRAIRLDTKTHKLIYGSPGSGKTLVLLHRARYLLDMGSKEKLHIFVFNNVLKSYIKSALDFLDLPLGCVSTFDSWCLNFYKEYIDRKPPWNYEERHPDFSVIRKEVKEWLSKHYLKVLIFDYVLIDEGQDLDDTAFEILKIISRHITVCLDHKQKIYNKGLEEEEI